MRQTSIFPGETWLDALRADVESAGGLKLVGADLWPELDPDIAGRKLSNALNVKQLQKLCYSQVMRIKKLARREAGRSQLHAHESGELDVELAWLTDEDMDRRSIERLESLMTDYQRELEHMKTRKRK